MSDPATLDEILRLGATVRDACLTSGDLAGLRELVRVVRGPPVRTHSRGSGVLAVMDEAAVAPDDAIEVLKAVTAGRENYLLDAEDLVAVARELARLGHDPTATATWIAAAIRRHASLDDELAAHEAQVRELIEGRKVLRSHLAWLEGRVGQLEHVLGRAASGDSTIRAALRIADDELGVEAIEAALERVRGMRQVVG